MKIVFMGTPDFAVPSLRVLHNSGKHQVLTVVTQPDKPKGRGKKLVPQAVKAAALELGLPILQPERIKRQEAIGALAELDADIFVVAAYGQILPKVILDMPKYGCVNVHASLLPKYRGASPIQQAIRNGDKVAGVTIMQMDVGLDTGDMLYKRELEIDANDTGGTLTNKLAELGAQALLEALELLELGELIPEKQNDSDSSYAPLITKEDARIDWHRPAEEIVNLVRAMNPAPAAFTTHQGEVFKIWQASVVDNVNGEAGVIVEKSNKNGLLVATGENGVLITELQAPGGKRMRAADYLRGHDIDDSCLFE